ncbi:hypothetical protein K9L05_04140 [Candidatus Babeliales bacterium]|nr:hypothetical protein [Candidatus Babeliales bacterium]
MKFLKKIVIFYFTINLFFSSVYSQLNLAIFDSATLSNSEKYKYHPFIDIAQSVGFNVDYKAIADFMGAENLQDLDLDQYHAAIFVISSEFFRNFIEWVGSKDDTKKSAITNRFLDIIEVFGQKKGKLTCLAFAPGLRVDDLMGFFSGSVGLQRIKMGGQETFTIKNFDINKIPDLALRKNLQENLRMLFININNFLNLPLIARSYNYATTLMPAHTPRQLMPGVSIQTVLDNLANYRFALPIKKNTYDIPIKNTFPYGIYWHNPIKSNSMLVTDSSLLTFSGIAENFRTCPMNFRLRKQMLDATQEMLWELYVLLNPDQDQNLIERLDFINGNIRPAMPEIVQNYGENFSEQERESFNNNLRKIGWTEIGFFNDIATETEEQKIERQNQRNSFIDYVLRSGIDALWVDFNPNIYYSPRAIDGFQEKRDQLWTRIRNFTKQLSNTAQAREQRIPKILVGFEIANNYRGEKMPSISAQDIYGHKYPSVPSPFDEQDFWHKEIIESLQRFLGIWNDPENSNEVPISGVVLDLEMYYRKPGDPGAFFSTMGFEKEITPEWPENLAEHYNFLQEKAENIGRMLKENIMSLIPDCYIVCYALNMTVDGFYKGFYKGLSSPEKPIQLLTFNSEFKTYKNWLNRNNIFINHSSVLMLSKIVSRSSFSLVGDILRRNSGIWFNKFHRLAETQDGGLEWSPLPEQGRVQFCDYIRTVR